MEWATICLMVITLSPMTLWYDNSKAFVLAIWTRSAGKQCLLSSRQGGHLNTRKSRWDHGSGFGSIPYLWTRSWQLLITYDTTCSINSCTIYTTFLSYPPPKKKCAQKVSQKHPKNAQGCVKNITHKHGQWKKSRMDVKKYCTRKVSRKHPKKRAWFLVQMERHTSQPISIQEQSCFLKKNLLFYFNMFLEII